MEFMNVTLAQGCQGCGTSKGRMFRVRAYHNGFIKQHDLDLASGLKTFVSFSGPTPRIAMVCGASCLFDIIQNDKAPDPTPESA